MTDDALDEARNLVAGLLLMGYDYSAHEHAIAETLFEDGILMGHSDMTTDLNDPACPDLLAIQTDHYDQHMDDDDEDTPEWEEQIEYRNSLAYVWFA